MIQITINRLETIAVRTPTIYVSGKLKVSDLYRDNNHTITSSTPPTSPFSGLSATASTAPVEGMVTPNVTGSKYEPRPGQQFLALHLLGIIL
jgi:hypothetical protein